VLSMIAGLPMSLSSPLSAASGLLQRVRGGLVVSCQAAPGEPLDDVDALRRLARAALDGGASGIRLNGPDVIAALRRDPAGARVPIIGIAKRYFGGELRITPNFAAAAALAAAGADIIAMDCTQRPSLTGEPWPELLRRIHDELHLPVMADIATVAEAEAAAAAGADLVGTTLCGYTPDTAKHRGVPWGLLQELVARMRIPVVAEGHIETPADARRALDHGAWTVVVGTAITRPRAITARFVQALAAPTAPTAPAGPDGGWVVGVDIGGTSVKAALVNAQGELAHLQQVKTRAKGGRDVIVASTERAIAAVLREARRAGLVPRAIGIASAGAIDHATGRVFAATENLPGWSGFALAEHFQKRFELPVVADNDAHASVLAEQRFGAGRGLRDFVAITIGTGLGGGIVADGHLLRGVHGFAGGIGHHTIRFDGPPCNCGRRGCLEVYVSAGALVKQYRRAARRHSPAPPLPRALTALDVVTRAQAGDAAATQALTTMAGHLAEGLANVWNFTDPEAVILAGGVVQDNPLFIAALETALQQVLPFAALRQPRVVVSPTSLYSGVQGAAVLAQEAES